jgi:uncharacterized protein (UPF0332 family)
MAMIERDEPFLEKALESLAGAESEFMNERFNNTANRAYYAVFHAAVAALRVAGIHPAGDAWSHEFVPSRFDGVLINRRHQYATALRGTLNRNMGVRLSADYDEEPVTRTEASRALNRSRAFVDAIERGGRASQ